MKKYLYIIIFTLISFKALSHAEHYKGIIQIKMDVLRNGEEIGYSNYFFEKQNDYMIVKNYTNFKVKVLGATIFSILSEGIETYKDNQLIEFKSNTFQNDKEKFVNLQFNVNKNKYEINGSSYTGDADLDIIIGNWWNHKILDAKKQVSPLSGSIKEQIVEFINEEEIVINNKNYLVERYKLKSKKDDLPKDKKLNFDIWYNPKNNIIMKIMYQRMGKWEYIVKDFK
tara:strand:+ start:1111 stop:1791 length:681 start_codon:yes stop_codon:yes gene_type:complete